MPRFHFSSLSHIACLLSVVAIGCNDAADSDGSSAPTANSPAAHGHDHPSEGPHHGDLVELGNEEYHAEIVHGTGGEVTVYVLDGKAATAVPIDAAEVTINLTHDGHAHQFKLAALPDASDPSGKSSRFMLKDEELASDLDAHGTAAKLVVSISGKSYTGKIEHRHEGEAGHAHGTK
jgi:hypothetical protein